MARRRRVSTRRRYARRIYGRVRRRAPKKFSIAIIGGIAAGVAGKNYYGKSAIESIEQHDFASLPHILVGNYTGFDTNTGAWEPQRATGLQGIIIGALVHKGMSMLGVNRAMAKMPSPLNKISI
jgi:hypothetical protein